MTGLVRSTVSPSSSSISRSTPWVEGCWGPMLMIMVSSSGCSMSMSDGSTGHALGEPEDRTTSRRSSSGSVCRPRRPAPGRLRRSRPRATARPSSVHGRPGRPPRRRRRRRRGRWARSPDAVSSMASLIGARGFLELDRHPADPVVLAQGMALPVLGHEDPGQVGMAGEQDAEHVEGLALHGLGPGVEVQDRGHHGVGLGHLHPDPDPARPG